MFRGGTADCKSVAFSKAGSIPAPPTIFKPNNNMNEQEEIQNLKSELAKLKNLLDNAIKVGNTMSIKTGAYPCAKHYQKELKDWSDVVIKYNEENQ